MQTLANTRALLNTHLDNVMKNASRCWNGKTMLTITSVDVGNKSVQLSDNTSSHINALTENMQANMFKLDSTSRQDVQTLINDLNKLVRVAYDYTVAQDAIIALKTEGYVNALSKKPKKSLYNIYTNKSSVTKGAIDEFAHIVGNNRLGPKEFEEFGRAYLEGFENGLADKKTAKEEKQKADRRCANAIVNSYPGDVDELITWLNQYASGVFIKAAREEEFVDSPTSEKCRIKALESLECTLEELLQEERLLDTFELEHNTGMFNCWELRLKPGHKETAPEGVREWLYDKKMPGDIDTYELGTVYKEKLNKLNSNPIVKDLVFNYGFKVGKYC